MPIFDWDGAVNNLIYSAEEVVYDGSTLASGYTYTSYGYNNNTHGLFYAKSRYNDAGGYNSHAFCYVPIDCTNFSKITVTYAVVSNSYSFVAVGLAEQALTTNNYIDQLHNTTWSICYKESIAATETNTVSKDISNITGIRYLGVGTYNTQGNQTDAIITKVVLE